ncbi:ADP-ribosylation factor-binding protein-like protein GGA1 [Mytilinidion resinicola]|uniref:ADP-ribosylation factor-binding protein-like protein GGA1 n=1 Tax=Mytilinidion resinicola TaxID=574789 RepID=A0A6A6Z208_9PEZI|nr:ADP-ribosylation factor-binding protein-like protein GGA1 [Mytilinidion resinicola]KAF2814267.1 ADP-ribosylation factor-binding protein-like protein GGA1 [Mytilinidion resinicola]
MATRDRFSGFGEPPTTPLQRYILNACDPQNFEPNLALNLEISDLINAKKGNAPREAAVAIVHYINHRNQNVSILALNLLDICVKNCGYPFHLQISTKEFLNELVRRFPERPPVHASRVQAKILELIEEWRQTICQTSRHKEDLGFIRDMHRLLSYKGYVFPEVRREDAAVLNPSDNLRSAEEMEEEERAAQSAKLQELIRRGGPHDLQEANKLMKVMAGYDTRNKTDYRAKAAEEVGKIQQKAKLLEEMLQGYKQGDQIKEGDVFEELANALASAQPKIQKMCEEESDDHEAVAKLFEINDSIHRTIERYKLIKKGDIEGASKIPRGTLGTSGAGVSKGPDNELSLIDFGGPEDTPDAQTASSSSQTAPTGNHLEDDLLGLSIGGDYSGQTGGISLGSSNGAGLSGFSSGVSSPAPPPQPQQPPSTIPQPNYDPFGSISSSQPPPPPMSPPSFFSQPQITQPQQPLPRQSAADPFAALSSPAPRQNSPFQFQQSIRPSATPAASNDLLGLGTPSAPASQPVNDDDEWTFASAVPDLSKDIVVSNTQVQVTFNVVRENDNVILIKSKISNNTAQQVTDLTFQVAVSKGYSLSLEPQSSVSLAPHQANGITQTIRLNGVPRGVGDRVKMRWKAAYAVAGTRTQEHGEIPSLGVA